MFASFIYFLGHLQGALWSSAPCAGLSPYRCHRLGLSTLCVIWYLFLPPSLRWLLRCILDMFIFWSLCQFVLWLSACVARFLVAPPTSCGGSVPGCCGGCRRVLFIECSLHNLCGVTLRLWWPLVRFFSFSSSWALLGPLERRFRRSVAAAVLLWTARACGGGVVCEREVGIGLAAISPFSGLRPRCGIFDVTVASGSLWWLSHGNLRFRPVLCLQCVISCHYSGPITQIILRS